MVTKWYNGTSSRSAVAFEFCIFPRCTSLHMLKLTEITIDWISQKCDVHVPTNHKQEQSTAINTNKVPIKFRQGISSAVTQTMLYFRFHKLKLHMAVMLSAWLYRLSGINYLPMFLPINPIHLYFRH